jgi:hypothetical protein
MGSWDCGFIWDIHLEYMLAIFSFMASLIDFTSYPDIFLLIYLLVLFKSYFSASIYTQSVYELSVV